MNIHPYVYIGLPPELVGLSGEEYCKQRIIESVCRQFGIEEKELLSKSRKQELAFARHVCIKILKDKYPHLTWSSLGKWMGGRDHSTAIKSYQTGTWLAETHKPFKIRYENVKRFVE